jgi:hypothetical protein
MELALVGTGRDKVLQAQGVACHAQCFNLKGLFGAYAVLLLTLGNQKTAWDGHVLEAPITVP